MDVLADTALHHFGTLQNVLVYYGVPLGIEGRVAVVMVKHPPWRKHHGDKAQAQGATERRPSPLGFHP